MQCQKVKVECNFIDFNDIFTRDPFYKISVVCCSKQLVRGDIVMFQKDSEPN